VKIKVCGVTCAEDALLCARLGVDWIGLNFYSASPRCICPDDARAILSVLPEGCDPVALFVDTPVDRIREIVQALGISIVQLHGAESPEAIAQLRGLRVVRAQRVADESDLTQLREYIDECSRLEVRPHAWLVDARDAANRDRGGAPISKAIIQRLAPLQPQLGKLILAGGLTPDNVAAAVSALRPWMVDVASGVESRPGRKDLALLERFVAAARGAR
jgi:phosphoribosylanthranilate isomerase